MTIFGPFLGHFRVLGHNSGHGPLRTKILGVGWKLSHSRTWGRTSIEKMDFFIFSKTPATHRTTLNWFYQQRSWNLVISLNISKCLTQQKSDQQLSCSANVPFCLFSKLSANVLISICQCYYQQMSNQQVSDKKNQQMSGQRMSYQHLSYNRFENTS